MINVLWHVSRQNLRVKGNFCAGGWKQTFTTKVSLPFAFSLFLSLSLSFALSLTHTHKPDSHLKMLEGFIFYKSSINGKVNVALNKTKLLSCNTALSSWAYCIIFLHQQVTIKFEFVGSFVVSFTTQPRSIAFCFNANAVPLRGAP